MNAPTAANIRDVSLEALSVLSSDLPGLAAPAVRLRDQRSFRDNLGQFATGVELGTADTGDGLVGMTVNSFTSVSLDPSLVAFCSMAGSETWKKLREVGSFAVTMLRSHQRDVSSLFAHSGADKFGGLEWTRTPAGHPILPDSLGPVMI